MVAGRAFSALDRKLLRDLWRLRGQVVSISLVIASGIALLVDGALDPRGAGGDHPRLLRARPLRPRLRELSSAHRTTCARASPRSRVSRASRPGSRSRRCSTWRASRSRSSAGWSRSRRASSPVLNQLVLRQGRLVERGRPDEVVLNESFAAAHGLRPGDAIVAVVNGRSAARCASWASRCRPSSST